MSKQDICQTILFARIANKPQLDELLGKEDAMHFTESCISYLSTIAQQHKGTIVKAQNEGLMCRFQNADDAVIAGKAMHQDLMYIKISDRPGAPPPNISIGINTDAANKKNDKDSATTEKAVAKLAAIGPSGQIITTKKVVTHLAADIKPFVRPFNPNTANGKNGKMKLYDIVWSTEGIPESSDSPEDNQENTDLRSCLELRVRDKVIEVDQKRSSISIGRQTDNDLVVREKPVSRTHARIEYRDDKFFLIDQSSNGTLVLNDGEEMKHIIKDEIELIGNGIIGVGKKADPNLPGVIRFNLQFRAIDA